MDEFLLVHYYEPINKESEIEWSATPDTLSSNQLSNKSFNTDTNYVIIKNIDIDPIYRYNYVFLPESVDLPIDIEQEGVSIYSFSEIVTNSDGVYTNSLSGGIVLYIITKNGEKIENLKIKPSVVTYGEYKFNCYNYIPNEIEIIKDGKLCYYYLNNNNYSKAITINELTKDDRIYITDKNLNEKYEEPVIIHSYYKNIQTSSYTILLPSKQFVTIQKANGNEIPTITVPDKLICTNTFTTHKTYDPTMDYTVTYKMSTLNNLLCKVISDAYEDNNVISPSEEFSLKIDYDRENGCVNIQGIDIDITFTPGRYKLLRADNKDEYKNWTPIKSYQLTKASDLQFKDCTVEQGISYQYAYQQFNNHGVHSAITGITDIIDVDFEYMYLGDKNRLIKLSFNSKVSSFKSTLFENKIDTLGGKYPFFFRNGNLNYKEFPITGLISYLLDQDEFFMTRTQLGLDTDSTRRSSTSSRDDVRLHLPTHNQVGYNFTAERLFRLELLDWLNNGKEKLFRSPTEGNYVVRLMNVSLTPNEQLSRMIADFSATAYECSSADIHEIVAAGRLLDTLEQDVYTYHENSVNINDLESNKITLDEGQTFERIKITGAFPGSTVTLYNREEENVATYTIGQTGTLDATNLAAANTLTYITTVPIGLIEYWIKQDAFIDSDFDKIVSITVVNKAETLEGVSETQISFNNVLEIYSMVCEPIYNDKEAKIQIDDEEFGFKDILSIDVSKINLDSIITLTNAKVHFYYKCYNEVYIKDNTGSIIADENDKYLTVEGGAEYVQ